MKLTYLYIWLLFPCVASAQQKIELVFKDTTYMLRDDILYNNHQPIENWRFKDNVPNGEYIVYSNAQKKVLKMKGNMVNGKKEGLWQYFNKEGVLAREVTYKLNKPHGEEKYYNSKTKTVMLLYTYYGGILEGEYYIKYSNGQLWEQGKYKNGVQEGEWKMWNREGKLIRRRIFNSGTLAQQENF